MVRYASNKWGKPSPLKGTSKLELKAVWVADDQEVFVVGKGGVIWRYAKQL